MKTEIYLGKIYLSQVMNNSGVFYGENMMQDWKTRAKTNYGLGRINGDHNCIVSRLNLLNDPDLIDVLMGVGGSSREGDGSNGGVNSPDKPK